MQASDVWEEQNSEPHEENMRMLLGPQGKECFLKQDLQITDSQRRD